MYSVDIYCRVRRACLVDGMSAREAALHFNKDRKTIAKMLQHKLPWGIVVPSRRLGRLLGYILDTGIILES